MSFPKLVLVATVVAGTSLFNLAAQAQLTDYTWTPLGGGTNTWQTSNWTQTGTVHASPYPNSSFHSANLSVGLSSSLTLNIDGVDPNNPGFVTVGAINMGGTSGAVTTNIASVNNGFLLLKNDDDADFNGDREVSGIDFLLWQKGFYKFGGQAPSDEVVNGDGDADADGDVDGDDLARWEALYANPTKFGNARIVSGGVPGSVNIISAPIRLSAETLSMAPESTNDLTLSGDIRPTGGKAFSGQTAEDRNQTSSIRNYSNKTLFITGNINTVDPANNTTNRRLFLNDGDSSRGTIHLTSTSKISGGGITHIQPNSSGLEIIIGSRFTNEANLPLTTVIMSAANDFRGKIELNRANLVLDNDLALGDPNNSTFQTGGPTGEVGFNILSTSDSRNIPNRFSIAQPTTFKGDHSLTWSGYVAQSNSRRGVINLLPAGKTLTFTKRLSTENGQGGGTITGPESGLSRREFPFDGTGLTLVTGGLHDDDINHNGIIGDGYATADATDAGATSLGTFIKRGSGVLKVSGTTSTFRGHLQVEGGNLHFDRYAHLSAMDSAVTGDMISTAGAVGLDSGSLDPSFIALFSSSTAAVGGPDTGGFMLAPSEAGAALVFGSTHTNLRLMTLAAPETGLTFTGTITTPTSGASANTFRLGGGSGKLTLAGSVLGGGGRSLYVANGGEVHITSGSNIANTAGSVEVTAKYVTTAQNQAAADDADLASNRVYLGTTLTASVLANGGVNSSIGAGSTADRLLIRGSTLKYVGAATSTNRLFTVGTGGATIDASGTGAVDFSGTGALVMEEAAPRVASNNSLATRSNVLTAMPSTDNLVIGMTVTGLVGGGDITGDPTIPANTTITDILSPTSIQLSNALPLESFVTGGTVTFGNFTRTFALTGTNTGNNFMRPLIGNASQGNVGVTKRGTGKWILTNTNSYSGPTVVEQGTLLINGVQSGGSAYSVLAGATLGGTGTLGGVDASLANSGTVAPGTSVGTLTVGGNYTQVSGAKLAIEMTGAAAFDKLIVNGSATLAGTIDVDLQSFVPSAGQTFDILTATSVTNSGLTVTGDGNWSVSVVGGNTLRLTFNSLIQAIPEPGTLTLLALGLLLAGRRRRG